MIAELDPRGRRCGEVVGEISRIERRIFPKYESLSKSLHDELRRRNTGLLYATSSTSAAAGGEEEEVIGYVMYSWVSSLCASITKLAVKENYRRQGHGEALLEAAILKCRIRKIERVILHVDPSRTAALSLYHKLGFKVDALVEGYYSSERNAYRMYIEFNDQS